MMAKPWYVRVRHAACDSLIDADGTAPSCN